MRKGHITKKKKGLHMDNSDYQDDSQLMTDEELKQQLEELSDDDVLDVMMKSLLIEKGIDDLDEETEKDVIAKMKEKATELVNYSLLDALPEEKAKELADKVENGGNAEELMKAALEESGVDAEQVVSDALAKFRELYLGEDKVGE